MKKEKSRRRLMVEKIVTRALGFEVLGLGLLFSLPLATCGGVYYHEGLSFYRYLSETFLYEARMFSLCFVLFQLLLLLGSLFLTVAENKFPLKIAVSALLLSAVFFTPVVTCSSCTVFELHGSSFTEDVANYGEYDRHVTPKSYFPAKITEEMTVVDYCYYFKYADCSHHDLYLEVRFEDQKTMEKHLLSAISAWEGNAVSVQNPYDEKYTDVMYDNIRPYSSYGAIEFGGKANWPYVDMWYEAISYSYEDLTVIYVSTSVGSDIALGNDPDRGVYTPRYLLRFGAEWDEEYSNSFDVEDLVTQA